MDVRTVSSGYLDGILEVIGTVTSLGKIRGARLALENGKLEGPPSCFLTISGLAPDLQKGSL